MAVIDQLHAASRRFMTSKKPHDIIYDQPGALQTLNKHAEVITGHGGTEITIPVENAAVTAASIAMYDGGNTGIVFAQDDLVTELQFKWKYGYAYTFIIDSENIQNSGPERFLNLHDIKVGGALKGARNLLNTQLLTGVHTNANDIHGLADIYDLTYATYGGLGGAGGIDLSDTAIGPYNVAIGGAITTMTKDHINEAFSVTWENDMHPNIVLANASFRQQVISLCLPGQNWNQGGNKWTIGPGGHPSWMGMCEIHMDRNMSAIKKAYGMNTKLFKLVFHWSGDGMKKSGWYDLRNTVGTLAYVLKFAVAFACGDPNENFSITWT